MTGGPWVVKTITVKTPANQLHLILIFENLFPNIPTYNRHMIVYKCSRFEMIVLVKYSIGLGGSVCSLHYFCHYVLAPTIRPRKKLSHGPNLVNNPCNRSPS
jgi:hypothetical protein